METNFGDDLTGGWNQPVPQAKGHPREGGDNGGMLPNVRSLRARLKMSQQLFGSTFHIPLATLKGWEQGRRQPDATAAAYLSVIEKMPVETQTTLESYACPGNSPIPRDNAAWKNILRPGNFFHGPRLL